MKDIDKRLGRLEGQVGIDARLAGWQSEVAAAFDRKMLALAQRMANELAEHGLVATIQRELDTGSAASRIAVLIAAGYAPQAGELAHAAAQDFAGGRESIKAAMREVLALALEEETSNGPH